MSFPNFSIIVVAVADVFFSIFGMASYLELRLCVIDNFILWYY